MTMTEVDEMPDAPENAPLGKQNAASDVDRLPITLTDVRAAAATIPV